MPEILISRNSLNHFRYNLTITNVLASTRIERRRLYNVTLETAGRAKIYIISQKASMGMLNTRLEEHCILLLETGDTSL